MSLREHRQELAARLAIGTGAYEPALTAPATPSRYPSGVSAAVAGHRSLARMRISFAIARKRDAKISLPLRSHLRAISSRKRQSSSAFASVTISSAPPGPRRQRRIFLPWLPALLAERRPLAWQIPSFAALRTTCPQAPFAGGCSKPFSIDHSRTSSARNHSCDSAYSRTFSIARWVQPESTVSACSCDSRMPFSASSAAVGAGKWGSHLLSSPLSDRRLALIPTAFPTLHAISDERGLPVRQ
jgi:hypothetical protein